MLQFKQGWGWYRRAPTAGMGWRNSLYPPLCNDAAPRVSWAASIASVGEVKWPGCWGTPICHPRMRDVHTWRRSVSPLAVERQSCPTNGRVRTLANPGGHRADRRKHPSLRSGSTLQQQCWRLPLPAHRGYSWQLEASNHPPRCERLTWHIAGVCVSQYWETTDRVVLKNNGTHDCTAKITLHAGVHLPD